MCVFAANNLVTAVIENVHNYNRRDLAARPRMISPRFSQAIWTFYVIEIDVFIDAFS